MKPPKNELTLPKKKKKKKKKKNRSPALLQTDARRDKNRKFAILIPALIYK